MQKSSHRFWATTVVALFCAHGFGDGLSPEEALKSFRVPEDLEVELVACEPTIRQPVNINFDERGRLWVVQYIQYPNPAGLKPVAMDEYLRTKYDRVPEPPPRGPRGADKITILEDRDGDGFFETAKDFVTGLNLASSVAVGYGGVWVAQTPYLLFYPDRDGDDVPDGPPEVVLSGFGMEDSHAVVNSLTFGPDGWLYGAQGSTCTANVRGVGFQQGAWRYHPRTKQFELFSEGGGNTFGLEWDAHGNLFTGTNYSNFVMLHYVQGGYIHQRLRQTRPAAQSVCVRLLRSRTAHGLARRPRHAARHHRPRRRAARTLSRQMDRAELAGELHRLARHPAQRFDLQDRAARRISQLDRQMVSPRGHQARPRRRGLCRRLVRHPRQSRSP